MLLNDKIKIDIIKLSANKVGGTEKCVSTLAKLLGGSGKYNIDIYAYNDAKEVVKNDEHAIIIKRNYLKNWHINYFLSLFHFFIKGKRDFIISTDICTSVFLIIIKLLTFRRSVKIFCWEHIPFDKNSKLFFFAAKLFYIFANKIIVLTNDELEKYPRYLKGHIKQMYNPINMPKIINPRSIDKCVNEVRLVTIGRLSKEKGIERLLLAISSYCERFPEKKILLSIVGDGLLRNELEKYAESCIEKNKNLTVNFLGSRFDIADILSVNDIYVSGSYYECLPTTVIEAFCLGLPVISFEYLYGTKEVIDNGYNGYLVKDVNSFISALSHISNYNEYCLFSECALKKSKIFDMNNILGEWSKMFNEY
ncbi:glycosyltransferase [Edwardsiella tarda]|uniref:glycosyltransferase n=1 Tax=Edwardsiella tarda TaxID=636 RepID=UPI000D51416B|nr:glycosyltransferase [Edwardsiella tarda]UCQ26692.1 glycosyltransferase [Edwardsiella tarda]